MQGTPYVPNPHLQTGLSPRNKTNQSVAMSILSAYAASTVTDSRRIAY